MLCDVARVLRSGLRDGDVLARYGGDEFCILLPNTDGAAAGLVAERLRREVAEHRFGPERDIEMRISVGIATSADAADKEGKATDLLLSLADEAMLRAKRDGGDSVNRYEPE